MRHQCVRAALALMTVFAISWCTPSAYAAESSPPNVLLIMVDDMGWSDLGCYGSEIDTPQLNRLAANGVRFTQFYNTAKCSQTRATLLSGLYHPEVRHTALRNCWTLGEAMRHAGYFTIMTGKWHLRKQPTDRGFDRYFGHLSGATNFFTGDKSFRLNGKPFAVPAKGFYTTDANTDYAIRFMKESKKADKPFFCYIAYNAPHYPLQAPEKDVRKYLGKYRLGWDQLRKQRFAKQGELGLLKPGWKLTPRPEDVRAWSALSKKEQQHEDLRMSAYAAMIDRVDQNIGKLVGHLRSTKSLENTLILFLSDNGACPFERTRDRGKMPWDPTSYWTYDKGWAHACNTPFREYKRNQHEGGISSPLIAHWPKGMKARPGSITHQPGHLVDVMATVLDLTDTKYPAEFGGQTLKPLRGKSLLPILAGKTRQQHEAIFFDFTNKHQAVRMGKWKLVRINRGAWELYDMDADRSELSNLAREQPERAARMRKAWESWARQAGVGKKRARRRRKKSKKKV